MDKPYEVVFNEDKKQLTILNDGKPVGGFLGDIAITMYKKIAFKNAKIEEKDGNIQIAV